MNWIIKLNPPPPASPNHFFFFLFLYFLVAIEQSSRGKLTNETEPKRPFCGWVTDLLFIYWQMLVNVSSGINQHHKSIDKRSEGPRNNSAIEQPSLNTDVERRCRRMQHRNAETGVEVTLTAVTNDRAPLPVTWPPLSQWHLHDYSTSVINSWFRLVPEKGQTQFRAERRP